MERLRKCRICLVENVRMYIVAGRNMYELYELLTDIPFVTGDIRPMRACYFCYAKLEQCSQLQRQCLKAEELFTQIMNKPNPVINRGHLQCFNGFVKSPIEIISIAGVDQMKSIAIKKELPTFCERPLDIIGPKEEDQSDVPELENGGNGLSDEEDTPPQHSESDLDIMELKTEIEEEQGVLLGKKRRASNTRKLENGGNGLSDEEDTLLHHSESDLDIIELKTEVEEEQGVLLGKKRRASDTRKLENGGNGLSDEEDTLLHHSESDLDIMELKTEVEEEQGVLLGKKRRASDTRKLENGSNGLSDEEDTLLHHSESDLDIMELKTEVEEEQGVLLGKKRRASDTRKLENGGNGLLDEEVKPPQHSESDLDILELKAEVEEEHGVLLGQKRRASDTRRATAVKKTKEDTLRINLEDGITEEEKKKEKSDTKVVQTTTDKRTRKVTFKEPHKYDVGHSSFSDKKHTGEKPYKCDICQRSFSIMSHLTQHTRTHTGEKPYKCNTCPRRFSRKDQLTIHSRIHTGEKPYKCDKCQRDFRVRTNLNNHIRTHTGEKPYKCDLCQRSYSHSSYLKRHYLTHTGVKPYNCQICQRSFTCKSYLKIHTRIHTGEKPYKCDKCQQRFSNKGDLNKHIRTHTGEKPYKCDMCELSFMRKGNLIKHIRTHTGEKPYKCDIFQRSFDDWNTLTIHTRIYTSDKL